ncbi:MAG TPA: hypothetical protein VGF67_29640 [Ktedonobacteraceae bacterium]
MSSLIATLRTVRRLPIRQLREAVHTLRGLEIRMQEIAEGLLHLIAPVQPALDNLKDVAFLTLSNQ